MNLKELREKFALLAKEMDALIQKGDAITSDDYTRMQALNGELDGIGKDISLAEKQGQDVAAFREMNQKRLAQIQTPVSPVAGVGTAPMTKSGEAFVENKGDETHVHFEGEGQITQKQWGAISTKEYSDAFRSYLRYGSLNAMPSLSEIKALQEGVDQSGGYLVPEAILARLVQKKPTPTRVGGMVQRLTTSRDHLILPKVIYATDDLYTTGIRVTWTGEIPASATSHRVTEPVFGQMRIPVYTAMLSCPITQDIIEDSMFGLTEYISGKFSETRDLLQDNMILNGTGVGQPSGLLNNPAGTDQPAVINTGDANLLTADGLVSIPFAIPEQYEENLRWVFNKASTAASIAQLKDGNDRYLWGMGVQDSGLVVPIRRPLLGYECSYSGFMPNVAANTYPIAFGDFSGYYLVERVALSVTILNEVYAEVNQKVLLGRLRMGGQVGEPWKMKIQMVAA